MLSVKMLDNGTMVFPRALRNFFKADEKIACFSEGDTLVIKKITTGKLSSLAESVKGSAPSLARISKEIHSFRSARK